MSELRQRDPRQEDSGFLNFIRSKPCCVCTAPPRSQAAHIRMACLERAKEYTGKAEKPHDRWCTPLCWECHLEQGEGPGGEPGFWERAGLDPIAIAERLYAQYCRRRARSPEQREHVTKRAVRTKRKGVQPMKRRVEVRAKNQTSFPKGRSQWPAKGTRKLKGRPFK